MLQGPGDVALRRQYDAGAVVMAAITSCTNTSNPGVMLGAGLLARKAVEKGLKIKKQERWIFGANCVHLSAKYLSTGLRHLLSIEDIKEKLLNKGSEQYQITPLHVSCLDQADSTSTKILLNFGASVEAKDNKGCTPLFYAAKENALENLLDLLEMGGADPNHTAKNGKTPLFKAHSYECALLLLQNKAQEGANLALVERTTTEVLAMNEELKQVPSLAEAFASRDSSLSPKMLETDKSIKKMADRGVEQSMNLRSLPSQVEG